ncbi:hypothetical protein [Desulfocastanea catecholica]
MTARPNTQFTLPAIENFRKIKSGMSMVEVVELIGIPDKVSNDGDGMLVLHYRLKKGSDIEVVIKYDVVLVRQIIDGVVVEIA